MMSLETLIFFYYKTQKRAILTYVGEVLEMIKMKQKMFDISL